LTDSFPIGGGRSRKSGVFFWIQSPFAFLCEELHIRGSLQMALFHSATLWVEGNHDVNAGESATSPNQLS
jgi:hypothetical protein